MAKTESQKASPPKHTANLPKLTTGTAKPAQPPAKNAPSGKAGSPPAKNSIAPTAQPKPGTPKKPRAPKPDSGPTLEALNPRRKTTGTPLKLVEHPAPPPRTAPSLIRRMIDEPQFFVDSLRGRPAWVDDLFALFLISLGMVTLLTLLNASPAAAITSLSDQWADLITQIFGRAGAIVFSLSVAGLGGWLILPRAGIKIALTWRRLLAIEVAFLAFLALLHLLANDPEPRSLARSGWGGGHIGWAIGEIMAKLFGSGLSILFFTSLMIVMLGAAVGVRRKHVRSALRTTGKRLEAFGAAIKKAATTPRPPRQPRRKPARDLGHVTPLVSVPTPQAPALTAAEMPSAQAALTPEPAPPPTPEPAPSVPKMAPARAGRKTATIPALQNVETAPSAPPDVPPTDPIAPPPTPAPAPVSVPMPKRSTPAPRPTPPVPDAEPDSEPPVLPVIAPKPAGFSPSLPTLGGLTASLTPEPAPIPERQRRYFTVEDFKETRVPIPREGLPPISLLSDVELDKPTEAEINGNARIIENTLLEFDIDVEVVDAKVGPTVTQYAVQPFREVANDQGEVVTQRVRVNKIASLAGDLALALAAKRLRIQPYVPGHSYMGIEVPHKQPSVVALRPVMESEAFARAFLKPDPDDPDQKREVPLVVPLGRDVSGEAVVIDLALMPHLLIAGTTGSGKSVCITSFVVALAMNNPPDRVKMILLDPKMVELSRFNGLPHLLGPVETDVEQIVGVLRWATREMDRRYKLLESESARNIEVYNRTLGKRRKAEHLPYIVIIIDEIGDLMLSRPEEVERTITRLAQMARAVGIHLVVATQRPSTDIITGLIKANFPARISFAVASGTDSRVILDTTGAETLMGRGDMLYVAPDSAVPRRVQGCYVTDAEIDAVVNYWRDWAAANGWTVNTPWDRGVTRRETLSNSDALLEEAIDLVVRRGEASTSLLVRQLGIDYPRASHLMDLMAELGILGGMRDDGRTREVLLKPGSDPYKKAIARARRGN
jgi:S-DNA-T family DNA segregation ATPase FtsK/SpoIIIE